MLYCVVTEILTHHALWKETKICQRNPITLSQWVHARTAGLTAVLPAGQMLSLRQEHRHILHTYNRLHSVKPISKTSHTITLLLYGPVMWL